MNFKLVGQAKIRHNAVTAVPHTPIKPNSAIMSVGQKENHPKTRFLPSTHIIHSTFPFYAVLNLWGPTLELVGHYGPQSPCLMCLIYSHIQTKTL